MAARVGPLQGPAVSYPGRKLIMKGPGGDCSRPGLWPTTGWVADMANRTCTTPGCLSPCRGRGPLCSKHYQRQWRQARTCSWSGCGKPRTAEELCHVHYRRQRSGTAMDAPDYGQRAGTECDLPDCREPHHAGGLCSKHAQRLRRTGDPHGVRRVPTATCTISGCSSPHMANGLCHRHYEINRRHGSPTPALACRACDGPFPPYAGQRGSYGGSYVYCPPCAAEAPELYRLRARQLRADRLRANNADMTDADRQDAAQYRAIILGDPCVYCGAASTTVDHIVPVAAGGGDWWSNLAPTCQECNAVKHDRPLLTAVLAVNARRGGAP